LAAASPGAEIVQFATPALRGLRPRSEALRQQRFDFRADSLREHRRCAIG
jgi:hypothetical protein